MNKKKIKTEEYNNYGKIIMFDSGASEGKFDELYIPPTIIDREHKALELIKEKRVDICYFMNCRTLEQYNDDVLASYAYEEDAAEQRVLTQEEFDLLKEVLQ